jgi:hypothetical protein
VAALSPALGSIFDLGVCVTLVGVSKPRRSLLLAADQRNPLVATSAEALPHIGIAIHAPRLLRLLERVARGGANTVREALVVPESRVLEHQPPTRLANTTPAFPLVAVSSHPPGRVQVALESELLLMGNEVLVGGVHVLGWWGNLFFVQRGVQVRRVREVGVVAVERVRIGIALKHPEEAVRKEWRRILELMVVRFRVESMRRQLCR